MANKIKRTFETSTRTPYQDSIAIILRASDFHMEQALKDKKHSALHMALHYKLKTYLIELKNFIHEKEKYETKETTTSSKPSS